MQRAQAAKKESSLDIRDIISVVVRHKWLIIIPLVVVTSIVFAGSYLLPEKYQSSTIIWIDRPNNLSRELASLMGGTDRYQRESGEERQRKLASLRNEITSQTYLYRLIQDLDLDNDSNVARKAARMRETKPNFSLEELKLSILLGQLRGQISVNYVGENQIELTAKSGSPTRARDLVTRLAEILEDEKTKYEMQKILDNQSFADIQLQRTEYDYQVALDSLTAARSMLNRLQLPENISSESNRRAIDADIGQVEIETQDYENERATLITRLAELRLDRARLRFSDTLVELRTEIDGQVATFASLMETYAWDQQNVVNVNLRLNNNIRQLEKEIERSVERQYASYPESQRRLLTRSFILEENIDILGSKRSQLQLSLRKIDRRISRLSQLNTDAQELERRVADARKYRDAFKSEETTVELMSERAKDMTKYKVIEAARVPLEPIWPNRVKIGILGLVLGLAIGAGAVLLVELLDHSFKRIEDVENELGLPVLATIPKIENMKSGA